jgi:threonine/homoserine/homoserine lactone efflux protein
MIGVQDIALFITAGLLLNITPGPDTAYIVGPSVQLGWRTVLQRRFASVAAVSLTSLRRRSARCLRHLPQPLLP